MALAFTLSNSIRSSPPTQNIVITGFNTDIEFDGVTYHVQTEDKGSSRPIILSLVYDRGTILASKRTPYDDLLTGVLDEKILRDRLERQHKLMCAAVSSGRIEDLKRMAARELAEIRNVRSNAKLAGPLDFAAASVAVAEISVSGDLDVSSFAPPIPKPNFETPISLPSIDLEDALIAAFPSEGIEIVLPDEAVEIVSEMDGLDRPVNGRLTIEILSDAAFRGGQRHSIIFMVCRGTERKVVNRAQVMVKILGSEFRPMVFHSTTDFNGLARVELQFPTFNTGRAAFLVRAISNGEEIELRRPIAHG